MLNNNQKDILGQLELELAVSEDLARNVEGKRKINHLSKLHYLNRAIVNFKSAMEVQEIINETENHIYKASDSNRS